MEAFIFGTFRVVGATLFLLFTFYFLAVYLVVLILEFRINRRESKIESMVRSVENRSKSGALLKSAIESEISSIKNGSIVQSMEMVQEVRVLKRKRKFLLERLPFLQR